MQMFVHMRLHTKWNFWKSTADLSNMIKKVSFKAENLLEQKGKGNALSLFAIINVTILDKFKCFFINLKNIYLYSIIKMD